MTSAPPLEPVESPPLAYASTGALPGTTAASLWALYVLTLRQHLHGRRWLVTGVLFLLPALIAVIIRSTARNGPAAGVQFSVGIEFAAAFMFIPQGLLPLVALLYASGMIQDELEEQTITYLLIRPIPRWALYLTKLLATLTTTTVLTGVFTALTYAAIYAGSGTAGADVASRCAKAMALHSLAVVAYCCLFGLMSLLTQRTLIVGIIYALLIEGLLANLPLGVRLVTVIYYARIIAYRSMSFLITFPRGASVNPAAEAWQLDVVHDPTLAEHPQTVTCVTVLVTASLACALLAAFLCTRKEFHVKTPEKN